MENFPTLSDNNSSRVLTAKDIHKAIEMLRETSKQPFIQNISSRYEWWKLLQIDNSARNFGFYGGILCIKDEEVPENTVRFNMSDGTHKDYPISNRSTFLSTSPTPPPPKVE